MIDRNILNCTDLKYGSRPLLTVMQFKMVNEFLDACIINGNICILSSRTLKKLATITLSCGIVRVRCRTLGWKLMKNLSNQCTR